MALRALVLQNRINTLHASLQELLAKDADFTAREESLTADIMAAQTEEERQAVDARARKPQSPPTSRPPRRSWPRSKRRRPRPPRPQLRRQRSTTMKGLIPL